jgi:hypothetical protein
MHDVTVRVQTSSQVYCLVHCIVLFLEHNIAVMVQMR